jgi:1,5-anhydro-D-fructose reductase (1,5-anhydro-D-mannitol-forming)
MKIAVLSFAHLHAVSYVRCLQALGVEVLTTDPDHGSRPPTEAGGPSLAAELGVAYAHSYAEVMAWRPDGVVVCSENARHRALVELAAGGGAHVLCEKPIATALEDASAMIAACAAARVNLMIAFPVRFSPAFGTLREAVGAGSLGTVLAITGTNNGRIPLDQRAWFVDPRLAGGGSLMDHTVHVADLLDSLLGPAQATTVYAVANRVLHRDQVGVETAGLVSIGYDNGVSATIDCSWSKPASYPTWGGLTLQVVGTGGIADMDAFGQRVDGHAEATGRQIWLPYGTDSDAAMVAEFVSSIAEGRIPQPDGAVGYRGLQIVLAGYESVRTQRVVTLSSGSGYSSATPPERE